MNNLFKALPGDTITADAATAAVVNKDGSFHFFAPMFAFEKADAPEGKKLRIGGVISTDTKDREGESILQDGLSFDNFLKDGFFNDNHQKGIAGIVGEPDPSALKRFKKGDVLPNGTVAKANGHWAEGWLYQHKSRAREIWETACAMQKSPTGRRLGFSIEGKILRRVGRDNKVIAQADVFHVATTHCPVNQDTNLDVIAKSLEAAMKSVEDGYRSEEEEQAHAALGTSTTDAISQIDMDGVDDLDEGDRPVSQVTRHIVGVVDKALSMGTPPANHARPSGPVCGAGAGATLARQSLEQDEKPEGVAKSRMLSAAEAISLVRERFPNISHATAGRIVDITIARRRGR